MKRTVLLSIALLLVIFQFTGCAPMRHTWPDLARQTENRIQATQERIGEALQRQTISLDQSQIFLATLETIRNDYEDLRGRVVFRQEWDELNRRIDALNADIDRAVERPVSMDRGENLGDRIIDLQQHISDGRDRGLLTRREADVFQGRLDEIRRNYLRMTEGGRYLTSYEEEDISRQLYILERDVDSEM